MNFGKKTNKRTKSPLRGKPLRYPGQSLDEEIERILLEDVSVVVAIIALFVSYAAMTWWEHFLGAPPNPTIHTIIAVLAILAGSFRIVRIKRRLRNLRLGRDGERMVGQYLEDVREDHWRLLHDVTGDGFNIDHLVICDRGVFVIETKTWRKPEKGEAKLFYDGHVICGAGIPKTDAPITQAKAAATWVDRRIRERTGRHCKVLPVIAFPGWFVERTSDCHASDVLVLSARGLDSYIKKCPPSMSVDDVRLVALQLRRMVRDAGESAI